jgi:hypothetical protein
MVVEGTPFFFTGNEQFQQLTQQLFAGVQMVK